MASKAAKKHKSTPPNRKKKLSSFDSGGYSILKNVFSGEAGGAWEGLRQKSSEADLALRALLEIVREKQEFVRHPMVGTGLQDFWLEKLLDDENPFHRKAELTPFDRITPSLARDYALELDQFIRHVLKRNLEKEAPASPNHTPVFSDMRGLPIPEVLPLWMIERKKIKEMILAAGSPEITREVAAYFFKNGLGLFGRHRAFRWESSAGESGRLVGITSLDPIRLENLVGYDDQRKPLIENIEAFVSGKPANNVLIYGERGTGKSSTVKALLNAYEGEGLRLVEVSPAELMDYHHILGALRGRREKFILFVDDLSFEENETGYKGLKALLEGTVESTPGNVILIATSNRRHLVREYFTEREEGIHRDGEVRGQDTVEEKLSLSDRFGLVISFYTPNQETYLRIVDQWAGAMGIRLEKNELHAKAILWARRNNGPSGRSAKQFINDLKGKT